VVRLFEDQSILIEADASGFTACAPGRRWLRGAIPERVKCVVQGQRPEVRGEEGTVRRGVISDSPAGAR